jgi:hypothetical protein
LELALPDKGTSEFQPALPCRFGFLSGGVDVDQILLVLFVAGVGSLLLPAVRVARFIQRGRTRSTSPYHLVTNVRLESKTDDMTLQVQGELSAGRGTIGEIKEQIDHPLAPSAGTGDLEFRPLIEEEKKEFMSNLDAKGRQILAELAGEAKSSSDPSEDVVPLCCL